MPARKLLAGLGVKGEEEGVYIAATHGRTGDMCGWISDTHTDNHEQEHTHTDTQTGNSPVNALQVQNWSNSINDVWV